MADKKFIEKCILDNSYIEKYNDYVEKWQLVVLDKKSPESELELYEFLGLTQEEYDIWSNLPSFGLQYIVNQKRKLYIDNQKIQKVKKYIINQIDDIESWSKYEADQEEKDCRIDELQCLLSFVEIIEEV